MKLIGSSNFDNETVDDVLIAENVPECYAEELCKALNTKYASDYSRYYYVVKPDSYILRVWEP